MKLIILSQYYAPDHSATGQILHELAAAMVRSGDQIQILTGQPTYAIRERRPSHEILEGVDVRRVSGTRFNKNTKLGKILNSLSFFAMVFFLTLMTPRKVALLIVSNPPFLPLIGWFMHLLKGQPYIYLVHDVYPDIAVRLGYLRLGGLVERLWNFLNTRIFASVSRVIVLSETMHEVIAAKPAIDPARIDVIHNWADGKTIVNLEKGQNPFVKEHQLLVPFVVQYSGNMGLFHDLEGLIEVARRTEGLPMRYLMIGDGGKRTKLQILAKGLDNVSFLPYQPKSELRYSLTACDVAIVTLEEGIEGLAAPSKLYGILAAGRAVVAIVEEHSYIRRLITEADCGVAVRPKDIDSLEATLLQLYKDPDRVLQMGRNARSWFETHFTLEQAVRNYRNVVERTIASSNREKFERPVNPA
ncbi:putative glycosyl transferase [compost metagenome]